MDDANYLSTTPTCFSFFFCLSMSSMITLVIIQLQSCSEQVMTLLNSTAQSIASYSIAKLLNWSKPLKSGFNTASPQSSCFSCLYFSLLLPSLCSSPFSDSSGWCQAPLQSNWVKIAPFLVFCPKAVCIK